MQPSTSGSLPGNLPRPLTSLIGRTNDVAEVGELLCRENVRLVTLTGPGGVGKTRLALAIASDVAATFPDGVWFVDLAPLRDSEQVIPGIAQVLGIQSSSASVQSLRSALGPDSRQLLLLDNFEQVIDAARLVGELLQVTTQLTVLITSREPLKVRGEREFPIAPLPTSGSTVSGADLHRFDASRLFAERAQAVLPSFMLGPENAEQVAEICRRLDGLPLAIELAAARIKALPPNAILARLDRRLPLLSGTRRDLPERQHTMRSAISWSYDLLSPVEQAVFRRLGVFVGGCMFDAAEAVCGALGDLDMDLLRDLSSLVDKSLVWQELGAKGDSRYLMLETIREFALDQLLLSEDGEATRSAHAVWCTALGEAWRTYGDSRHEPEMAGRSVPPLEAEYDNVRAALTWLDESGRITSLARLAGAIWWYWIMHGPRSEGMRWLQRARVVTMDTHVDKTSRLWVMQGICSLARNQGDFDEAISAAQDCLALSRALGDTEAEATATAMTGYISMAMGDYDASDAFTREAMRIGQQTSNWRAVATYQVNIGQAAFGRGDFEGAATTFEASLAVHRASGDAFDVALELNYLSLARCGQGQYREAGDALAQALPLWQDIGSQENMAEWLANVAMLAAACGSSNLGASLTASAVTLRDEVGHAFTLPERAAYERTEHALRVTLGDESFARAWLAGSIMPVLHAITAASAFLDQILAKDSGSEAHSALVPFGLTSRELDVLRLLVDGKADREIADALFIGLRTVQTHVSNILAKLQASNRAEAAVIAVRQGVT